MMQKHLALLLSMIIFIMSLMPVQAIVLRGNPTSAPLTVPVLTPGGTTNPAVDASLHGSGSTMVPAAAFDIAPNDTVDPGDTNHITTAYAATNTRGAIASMKVCLAGNCITIAGMSHNSRTGDNGWNFIPTSIGASDGQYELCLYATPTNGYQRKRCQQIFLDNNSTITRPTYYVDYTNGNNGNSGTSGSPWKTINYAVANVSIGLTTGAIIYGKCPNSFVEDNQSYTVNNNAGDWPIEVRPDPGSCSSSTYPTITKSTRTDATYGNIFTFRANLVNVYGFNFDMSKFVVLAAGGTNAMLTISGEDGNGKCGLIDPNGPSGPTYGYSYNDDGAGDPGYNQQPFRTSNSIVNLIACPVTALTTAGLLIARNSTWNLGWDAIANSSNPSEAGEAIFNVKFPQSTAFNGRLSVAQPSGVIIASVSNITGSPGDCAGVGGNPPESVLTYTGGTVIENYSNDGSAFAQILGGTQAGTYQLVSQSASGPSTTVCGTITSAAVSQQTFLADEFHADADQTLQFSAGDSPLDNILIVQYNVTSNYPSTSLQPVFNQATDLSGGMNPTTGNLSATGTAVTFASAQSNLKVGDCVQVTASGTDQYIGRVVTAISDTTHATVNAAWPSDPSGVTWGWGKTVENEAIVASAIEGSQDNNAQFQGCSVNWAFVQDTIDKSSVLLANSNAGWAMLGVSFLDTVMNGNTGAPTQNEASFVWNFPSTPVTGVMPDGVSIDNVRMAYYGDTHDSNVYCPCGTNNSSGLVIFNYTTWKQTGGTTLQAIRGEQGGPDANGTPIFPWALDGTAITSSALIGAQGI